MSEDFLLFLIREVSLMVGLFGIAVIVAGAVKAFWQYINPQKYKKLRLIRRHLASHTILGLDFLVGKDIIDTLLLNPDKESQFYANLIGLFAVVLIRIILTHFTAKEINEIDEREKIEEKNGKK